MTCEEADRMMAYWRRWPPTHVLLRGYVGFKPADDAPSSSLEDVREIAGKLGAG